MTMWIQVRRWFEENAGHSAVEFFPEPDAAPLPAYGGYVRLWLTEGFLAKRTTWGRKRYPVLHGGVSLAFLGGEPSPFRVVTRPPEALGAQLDFPVTPLLPWNGGTLEVEAALYRATVNGPLATAVEVVGGLASLFVPPLATAAAIAGKISEGLDAIIADSGDRPVLSVHWSMTSPGGGSAPLRPGRLAVINVPEPDVTMRDGQLWSGERRFTEADYLVLRVECREERDDWRFPELDAVIRSAVAAAAEGFHDAFRARRTEAITRAWNCADLTPNDRKRVARLVADEIDSVGEPGAAPGPETSIETSAHRLLALNAPELGELQLEDLLAG